MIFSRFKWDKDHVLELTHPITAYIYYRHQRMNLVTGFPEAFTIDDFIKKLDTVSLQDKVKHPRVYHFYYAFGLYQQGIKVPSEDTPLAIEIEYRHSKKMIPKSPRLTELPLKTLERPSWSEYKEAFEKIQNHLLDGNCYQVNLTYPYDFETEEVLDPRDIADYFFAQNVSAFAHATYFGEEMFLSNSPECLFQFNKNELMTMPIKGTAKRGKSWKKAWKEMQKSPKEESELLMITDLLKNDLNRLEEPVAKVLKLRAPLLVPGLLHQYSLIKVKISQKLSLKKTMDALFPGGSITGAPKIRVMDIISEVERYDRGIYCGSTLLFYKNQRVASINIRTACINISERIWRYGAGGGVTLLSKAVDEFKEMESKVESFLRLLKIRGY
jgi:anthranilate/para-aminobenzoate synthase component I